MLNMYCQVDNCQLFVLNSEATFLDQSVTEETCKQGKQTLKMLAFLCYHSPLLLSLHVAYCISLDVMLSSLPLFFFLQLFTLPANQKLVALVYLQHLKIFNVQAHYSKTAFIYSGWSLKPCKQESHCTCPVGVKEAAIVILSSWHRYFLVFHSFSTFCLDQISCFQVISHKNTSFSSTRLCPMYYQYDYG